MGGGDRVNGTGQARVMRRELGQRLRKLREEAGLSQQQLARRAGYTRSAVSNDEAGGYARRRFWELCDEVFGSGQTLARGYDEIRQRSAAISAGRAAGPERGAGAGGLELLHDARDTGSADDERIDVSVVDRWSETASAVPSGAKEIELFPNLAPAAGWADAAPSR